MTTMLFRPADAPNPEVWDLKVEYAVFDEADVDAALDDGWTRRAHDAVVEVEDEPADPEPETLAPPEPEPGTREHMRAAILVAFTAHIDALSDDDLESAFQSIGDDDGADDEAEQPAADEPPAEPVATVEAAPDATIAPKRRGRPPKEG